MADPAKEMARAVCSFFEKLKDAQIEKLYLRMGGDERQRQFPALSARSPVANFNRLYAWGLVNEHDRRQVASETR